MLDANKTKVIPYIVFGLVSVAYGVTIYYILPLAIFAGNFGLIL